MDIERQLEFKGEYPTEMYMNWEQINQLIAEDWDIGGHCKNHPILTVIPPEKAKQEIAEGTEEIAAKTGKKPRFFAYPNGKRRDFNDEVIDWLKGEGYIAAVTMEEGLVSVEPDVFRLPRVAPKGGENRATFYLRLSGLYYRLYGIKHRVK